MRNHHWVSRLTYRLADVSGADLVLVLTVTGLLPRPLESVSPAAPVACCLQIADLTIPFAISENSTVAIFGAGCVGLALLQGASVKKASRIISVDTNPKKKEVALKFGATEFINPLDLPEGKSIAEHLVEITDGGLDFTYDATGNVSPLWIRLDVASPPF